MNYTLSVKVAYAVHQFVKHICAVKIVCNELPSTQEKTIVNDAIIVYLVASNHTYNQGVTFLRYVCQNILFSKTHYNTVQRPSLSKNVYIKPRRLLTFQSCVHKSAECKEYT